MKVYLEKDPIPVMKELISVLQKHKEEACLFGEDVDLDPNWDKYENLWKSGKGFLATARKNNNEIIGYAVNLIDRHLHYNFKYAVNDIIYMHPKYRGHVMAFIKHMERHMKRIGIDFFIISIKPHIDFRPVMKKLNYNLLEYLYFRRL